jgi:hypothetical protein
LAILLIFGGGGYLGIISRKHITWFMGFFHRLVFEKKTVSENKSSFVLS